MKKGLWVTDSSTKDRLLAKAKLMGASSVCVRTDNHWLKESIADFHAEGIEVYGWRWPAVEDKGFEDSHYFAQNQADHVANELDARRPGWIRARRRGGIRPSKQGLELRDGRPDLADKGLLRDNSRGRGRDRRRPPWQWTLS